ncbi:MAG: catechol 2,3-dioxygenase-like lactoylglutathione lyase family enzyme [Ilumatobacter sp.]|jgi:catechol 2,3-dioxygenase-like lactoylglutathione lyase family enzyme
MIRGIHHLAITTPDIDRLARFYIEAFGFEEISRGGWHAGNARNDAIVGLRDSATSTAFLRAGNLLVEMFQYHEPSGASNEPDRPVNNAGYTHFCLDVVDIDAEYRRLSALGMTFNAPVGSAMGGIRAMYGRDPDGNIVELIEFVDSTAAFSVEEYPTEAIRA